MELDKYTPLVKLALDKARANNVYAIVRIQKKNSFFISVNNGNVEGKSAPSDLGMNVSVFTKQGYSSFASTPIMTEESVKKMVDAASVAAKGLESIAYVESNAEIFDTPKLNESHIIPVKHGINTRGFDSIEKIILENNKWTRDLEKGMNTKTIFSIKDEIWRIARSNETDVTFNMPNAIIASTMTLKEGGEISEGYIKVQGTDLNVLMDDEKIELYQRRVINSINLAKQILVAPSMKGGHYKALLSYDFAGLYVHEAVGHGFESDNMNRSIFAKDGKFLKGKKFAPSNITFIDGPIEEIYGNQFISSNGIERKTVKTIENGILGDSISDVFSGRLSGSSVNGCGRAETYRVIPIPRMSTTRMIDENPIPYHKSLEDTTVEDVYKLLVENGELKPGEKVVYPVHGSGGQVDSSPPEGNFMFGAGGIYVLENPDKITLYKQASFSGPITRTLLTNARGIGPVIVDWPGSCGKANQRAPVSAGGNMFFIMDKSKDITFGGE